MSLGLAVRRRPGGGGAHGPVLHAGGGDDDGPPTKASKLFLYLYLPTVLFVMGLAEGSLATAFRHWAGLLPAAAAVTSATWLLAKRPKRAGRGWRQPALLGLMLLLGALLFVRIASMHADVDFGLSPHALARPFPQKCPLNKVAGCKRVAQFYPHPTGQHPPRFAVTTDAAVSAVEEWAGRQLGAALLVKRTEAEEKIAITESRCTVFLHYRMVSLFLGAADDFFVNVECIKARKASLAGPPGVVQVSVQSQARLGERDMGSNTKRVINFLHFLEKALAGLPPADCEHHLRGKDTAVH